MTTENVPTKKRIEMFDIAKGIAIIAIIAGHMAIRVDGVVPGAHKIVALCFTFHLPVFFVLSGYFIHIDRPFAWKKEAQRLIIPYIVCALVIVFLVTLFAWVLPEEGSIGAKRTLLNWLNAAVYGAVAVEPDTLWPQTERIGALWFLLGLFWARMFTVYLGKLKCAPLWIGILFIVGWQSRHFVLLPFSLQAGMSAAAFVYLGHWLKKWRAFDDKRLPVIVWPIFLVIYVFAVFNFEGFSMGAADYGYTPLLFFKRVGGGIAGVFLAVKLSRLIELHARPLARVLVSVGQNTMSIMCVHVIEDDVLRWGILVALFLRPSLMGTLALLVMIVVRVCADSIIAWLLVKIPLVACVMGVAPPQKAGKKA